MNAGTEDYIRAEGAELFVRAHLMLHLGIPVSVASRNTPGYDLIAHSLENERNCFIQVKYRMAVDADGAKVTNLNFDFMVYVAGNLGKVGVQGRSKTMGNRPTEFYILPKDIVGKNILGNHNLFRSPTRGKYEEYRDAWNLIQRFLISV